MTPLDQARAAIARVDSAYATFAEYQDKQGSAPADIGDAVDSAAMACAHHLRIVLAEVDRLAAENTALRAKALPPHERRLAAHFLEVCADELGNHGCNDWEWPDWFPVAERADFVRRMEMANSGDETAADESIEMYATSKHGPGDSWVARYLSGRLAGAK